ncbi:AAA family ATPase, partial [Candidatus Roizmanbacteria bacterium CG10_big_fil_rev_8_21_14_0_10_39_6]
MLIKIALQIGQEVSLREIAGSLQANVTTVSNYIEVFVKNYILLPLPSFKTNMRKAVSENKKYFFFDLGIRNALVRDFRPLDLRPDKGGVFENFIIAEIEKKRRNKGLLYTPYFYREYGGREVDMVLEDYQKEYTCFEIKYQEAHPKKAFPLSHSFYTIHKDNY